MKCFYVAKTVKISIVIKTEPITSSTLTKIGIFYPQGDNGEEFSLVRAK